MAKNGFIAEGLKHKTEVCGPILALNIVAMVFINTNSLGWNYGTVWICTAVLLTLSMMVIGAGVNGRLQGVLIDGRNRVSLSKFQMALWTVLVISGLITAGAFNQAHGATDAAQTVWKSAKESGDLALPWGVMNIRIPTELLEAMGIATASLVATPALLSVKSSQTAAAGALADTTSKLGLADSQTTADGNLFANTHPASASWTDMFRGDEVGNASSADLSKVQQFAITVLLFGIYASTLWTAFWQATDALTAKVSAPVGHHWAIVALPPLSSGFVLLMGISHAGYLAYKAAPHSPNGDNAPAP